jgi:uncharacterized protein involved in exopolysaccharide biosynthesis
MVLFRQRKVFVIVASLAFAASLFYVVAGDRYRAEMKVLVRPGRADPPVSAQESAPIDLTRLAMTEEDLNSEVELLRDDEVLRNVVEQTGVGRDWLNFMRPGEGHAEQVERAARKLAKRLQVEPVKKTNLIAIRYASGDPAKAARILQAVADAYLQKHTVVHRPNGEVEFFERQTAESRRHLEDAKKKLLQFTVKHRVVEAAQERDLALQKLSEADANHRQTRIDLEETRRRIVELQGQLASLPERSTTQIRTADNPELLKSLKASLLDLQLKRIQLLTKFEPSHRLVQEVEKQIAEAQAAIGAENLAPVRDETTDKNTNYEWAKAELQHAQVQLKALETREAATGTQEAAYSTMAQSLGEDAITQGDLESSEKAAQDNYLLYVKKQEEARMADALDQRGIANVTIAEQPVAPALPLWSTGFVLMVGLVGAGVAGAGAAFTADYVDVSFRTPDDVVAYLGAPVLASLPRSARGRLMA